MQFHADITSLQALQEFYFHGLGAPTWDVLFHQVSHRWFALTKSLDCAIYFEMVWRYLFYNFGYILEVAISKDNGAIFACVVVPGKQGTTGFLKFDKNFMLLHLGFSPMCPVSVHQEHTAEK
jgi:hypothetical protein